MANNGWGILVFRILYFHSTKRSAYVLLLFAKIYLFGSEGDASESTHGKINSLINNDLAVIENGPVVTGLNHVNCYFTIGYVGRGLQGIGCLLTRTRIG